jgi:hypothetical protein
MVQRQLGRMLDRAEVEFNLTSARASACEFCSEKKKRSSSTTSSCWCAVRATHWWTNHICPRSTCSGTGLEARRNFRNLLGSTITARLKNRLVRKTASVFRSHKKEDEDGGRFYCPFAKQEAHIKHKRKKRKAHMKGKERHTRNSTNKFI